MKIIAIPEQTAHIAPSPSWSLSRCQMDAEVRLLKSGHLVTRKSWLYTYMKVQRLARMGPSHVYV